MTDKDLKEAIGAQGGGCGLTLNVKNLHIHLDERMTNNTYYHEPHYDAVGDPFDDDDDWDEGEAEDEEESESDCEHCADCGSCSKSEDTPTIASVHNLKGGMVPMDELIEAVHDKTDVGTSTVYRVLNSFFKCLDERSESALKGHSGHGANGAKKGAAYEE